MEYKLRLRPYKREDGACLSRWLTDRRILGMWCRENFSYPLTQDQLAGYYRELENDPCSFGFKDK